MPFIVVGLALYLLYRYYAQPPASAQPAVVDLDSNGGGGGDQPAAPTDNGGGGGGTTPTPSPPAPSTATVSWQAIPEGAQLQPGFDYRASAPPQNFMVMALIPSHLASAGFTNVQNLHARRRLPNDWPDTGNALRIEATLPAGAQPQTFNLDGVSVWRKVVTQTAAGGAAGRASRRPRRVRNRQSGSRRAVSQSSCPHQQWCVCGSGPPTPIAVG